MKLYFALFFVCGGLLPAQVSAPNVGSARFAGQVFAVHGIPANLLVAPAPWTSADAISFSDTGGLLAQNGTIRLVGPDGASLADYAVAETAPLPNIVLNIDGPLTSAIAWLPSKHALLHWNGTAFVLREVNGLPLAGAVTSLRLVSPDEALLLVTKADAGVSAVTVSLVTGEVTSIDPLPSAHGRAFIQCSLFLSQDEHGLVVESAGGAPRTIALVQDPLPEGDLTIERMSTDWLHIFSVSTGKHWALYLKTNVLRLSALPVPPAMQVGK